MKTQNLKTLIVKKLCLLKPHMSRQEYEIAIDFNSETEVIEKCDCNDSISCTGWRVLPKDFRAEAKELNIHLK